MSNDQYKTGNIVKDKLGNLLTEGPDRCSKFERVF